MARATSIMTGIVRIAFIIPPGPVVSCPIRPYESNRAPQLPLPKYNGIWRLGSKDVRWMSPRETAVTIDMVYSFCNDGVPPSM